MGGAIPTTIQAASGAASSSHVKGASSNQIATHAGLQAKARPSAVHVGVRIKKPQLRAVHVGTASETQMRAVHEGAASQQTELQTVDQGMAVANADHDMADVAVVEHTRNGNTLTRGTSMKMTERLWILWQARAGVERDMAFMEELGVGELCDCPKTGKVWSTRWCYRRKGDTVRSRLVLRQFREGTDPSVHAGTPGPEVTRILLTVSAIFSLFAATADLILAFVHTPMTEEVFVVPPEEASLPKGTVCRLRRALNGLRCAAAAFQAYLENLLDDVGFRRGMAVPSIYNREDDGYTLMTLW